MPKRRRRRRATLRGWWRALPFVGLTGGLLFCFTWLETERLHNEYRAIELTREIRRVKDHIDELDSQRHRLSRFERMQQAAPELKLIEPTPGQIETISIEIDTLRALLSTPIETPARRTRSAYLNLNDAPRPSAAMAGDELAKSRSGETSAGPSHF